MINNQLQVDLQWFTGWFIMVYNDLQLLLQSITITSVTSYNRVDNQLQYHCNKILGTVHNGLSTTTERLLTKVQATGEATGHQELAKKAIYL